MFKNYFRIALRQLAKNYLYVLANLIGLSFGIACCILAFFNWEFHQNFDGIHHKADDIYRIQTIRTDELASVAYGVTPLPLIKYFDETSGLTAAARYQSHYEVIKKDEVVLHQQVAYVDPAFTSIFDFPMLHGSKNLDQPDQAIVTKKSAMQFFGNEHAIGQLLQIQTEKGLQLFTIVGVIDDHLLNTSFKFEILLNYKTFINNYSVDEDDWTRFTHATFVELTHPEEFLDQVQSYLPLLSEARDDWQAEAFTLVNLKDMSIVSREIRENYLGYNNPEGAVMIPVIMAIIILLVACFNYMNTSISLSSSRLKEIGVRKAIGAHRYQLIAQILTENVLLLVVAFVLGLFLVQFLIPAYNQLGPWIEIVPVYRNNPGVFLYLAGLLLITAILSGAYPAFYVSKFQTTQIFSGRFKLKSTGALTKVLMVLQLSFSLISLIQGIVYIQNTTLQKNYDLGYNKLGVVTIPIQEHQYQTFKKAIESHSGIRSVSGASHHVGYGLSSTTVEHAGKKEEVRMMEVGPLYLQTMDMKLNEGRYFQYASEEDKTSSVIVNRFFMDIFQITDMDQRIIIEEKPYHIIGVVEEFYPYGLWRDENALPLLLQVSSEANFNYLVANVTDDVADIDGFLKKTWLSQFPNTPYESDLINMHVERSELLSENMGTMNFFLAAVALFLSATGLFTLISLNIQKRTKEIGLRKVMGASVWSIIGLVNKEYFILVMVSLVIGSIMGIYMTEMFLDLMFSIHAHPGPVAIGLTSAIVLAILLLTGSVRVWQAANTNPVESLKMDN